LYFARGQLHAIRDERTNAIDDFTQSLTLKPDFLEAYKQRAFMYMMLAQYDKAEKDANKLVALDPTSDQGYETRGGVYGAREQYDLAIKDWQHAIAINNHHYFYYCMATNLLKLARYDEAEKAIDKAIELADSQLPGDSYTYRGVAGIIATFRQDFPTAQRQLTAATESADARGVEWSELAYYYLCAGQRDQAQKAIEQARQRETFPARSFRLAGEFYRTAGDFDKAIQEFSNSTSLEDYPPGYRERAVTYIAMEQWRSAYNDLKKAAQLNPYSGTTLSYLALVENHLSMNADAAMHMAKAFQSGTPTPIMNVIRAAVALHNGDVKTALADANTALSKDKWLKEGYQVRSQIYKKMNESAKAQEDQTKADGLVSHFDL
jgi:tetratricopeptide (TPR) repeat protein